MNQNEIKAWRARQKSWTHAARILRLMKPGENWLLSQHLFAAANALIAASQHLDAVILAMSVPKAEEAEG